MESNLFRPVPIPEMKECPVFPDALVEFLDRVFPPRTPVVRDQSVDQVAMSAASIQGERRVVAYLATVRAIQKGQYKKK